MSEANNLSNDYHNEKSLTIIHSKYSKHLGKVISDIRHTQIEFENYENIKEDLLMCTGRDLDYDEFRALQIERLARARCGLDDIIDSL